MQTLHKQVANHMCICEVVGSGIEKLYDVASSELILSEVASYIMHHVRGQIFNDQCS